MNSDFHGKRVMDFLESLCGPVNLFAVQIIREHLLNEQSMPLHKKSGVRRSKFVLKVKPGISPEKDVSQHIGRALTLGKGARR